LKPKLAWVANTGVAAPDGRPRNDARDLARLPDGSMTRAVVWAPCGFDTPGQRKASYQWQLNTLSSEIDAARGDRTAISVAYRDFADRVLPLLDRCDANEGSRIALSVQGQLTSARAQSITDPACRMKMEDALAGAARQLASNR